jgi:hypothetical protein
VPIRGGFSALTGEIQHVRLSGGGEPVKTSVFSEISAHFRAGAALAFTDGEHHVFRAALFSIVLTLAVGQNAGLLCRVSCDDATSAACPHQESTTSPSVRTGDTCANVAVGAVAFIREDGRRTAPAPDAPNALVVRRFQLVAPPTDLRPAHESGLRMRLEERPLVIALRI